MNENLLSFDQSSSISGILCKNIKIQILENLKKNPSGPNYYSELL